MAAEQPSRAGALAAQQIEAIVEAAERSAQQMRREAEQEAERIRSEAKRVGREQLEHARRKALQLGEDARAEAEQTRAEAAREAAKAVEAAREAADLALAEAEALADRLRTAGEALGRSAERVVADVQAAHRALLADLRVDLLDAAPPAEGARRGRKPATPFEDLPDWVSGEPRRRP